MYTIHNIEYQGRWSSSRPTARWRAALQAALPLARVFWVLDRSYFNEGMLAYHRDVNLMKGAIMASNFVTTVSPTYAQELRTPFYAHGQEIDGDQGGLPIVAVDDIGGPVQLARGLHHGPGEVGEALTVVKVISKKFQIEKRTSYENSFCHLRGRPFHQNRRTG